MPQRPSPFWRPGRLARPTEDSGRKTDRSTKCSKTGKIRDHAPTVDRRAMENPGTLTSGKQTAQPMEINVQSANRKDIMQGFVSQQGQEG
jgi:hypothetical protein